MAAGLVAAVLWPAGLHAGTYYVAERGRDDGPGSARAPWKTLQHAAETVGPGDTVVVRPGVYDGFELTRSGTPKARIRFVAEKGVIVDRGPGHDSRDNINLEGASYVDIEGFEVTSAWRAGIRAVECERVRIRGNVVHDNGRWAIFTGFCDDLVIENNVASGSRREHGIYVSNSPKRPVIRGNRIAGNRQAGIHMNGDASMGREGMVIGALVEGNLIHDNGERGGAGINCDGCQDAVFRNNILHDNHANGITLYRIDARRPSTGNRVVHNTIWMSDRARWCIRIVDGSTGNTFASNICLSDHATHGAIDIDEASLRGFTSDHNVLVPRFTSTDGAKTLAMDGWRKLSGQDRHSITAAAGALFVDAARRDLRLADGSAAIDRGDRKIALKHDYFGHARPAGAAPDAGAVERCAPSECRRASPHAGPPLGPHASSKAALLPAAGSMNASAAAAVEEPGAAAAGHDQAGSGHGAPAASADTPPRPPATPDKVGSAGCCKAQATAEVPAGTVVLGAAVLLLLRRRA